MEIKIRNYREWDLSKKEISISFLKTEIPESCLLNIQKISNEVSSSSTVIFSDTDVIEKIELILLTSTENTKIIINLLSSILQKTGSLTYDGQKAFVK